MRINKYLALATGLSRRAADAAITAGEVSVNDLPPQAGQDISADDTVLFHGTIVRPAEQITLLLNKPVGYVCSRDGQGSQTIYNLLPPRYHNLKSVGRLDKNSSGVLLLTNNGELAQQLTHPSYGKNKVYEVELDKKLTAGDKTQLSQGVPIEDYISRLELQPDDENWLVTMTEGKNRQIRKTFSALGYEVKELRRIQFGEYKLGQLRTGHYTVLEQSKE